jgi:hypothetical protein
MTEDKCSHQWDITNIQPGYIITEKCSHCHTISNYFSDEEKPPMEMYREGVHFWKVMEIAQSIRFDLKCKTCSNIVQYDELGGIMLCTGCDDECEIGKMMKIYEHDRTWLYVAFGFLPVQAKKILSSEKIIFLEEYFNQRRKSTNSRVKFVSHEKINNIATCYAEIIKDVGMLSLSPEAQP